ncbi:MAG: anaerobic ribonucleoside-triphosphate reductase activating protein [Oscillospiraceae bacterium]|jgi:anaerobic ribonucleoside-triphosphate reductase activating protein|nr:anaerobic ribonucleoside-triphosphate reductase activating protein [Oscillospiraceae bacterium]
MTLRVSDIIWESIVDGPGFRCAVFAQGCDHNCDGCHNPQTWNKYDGNSVDIDGIIQNMRKNPLLRGITLSGGEPFMQADAMAELARKARAAGYDVVAYTGYTFDELMERSACEPGILALLEQVDLLIDGPYDKHCRNLNLLFRGSENQRLVDVKKSLMDKNEVFLVKEEDLFLQV